MIKDNLKNKGMAIILIAGILVGFLLVFAVLAIDFSRMYYVRGELQSAADAAALAGAARLDGTNNPTQEDARVEAVNFALKNKAAGEFVLLDSDGSNNLTDSNDITVGNWNPSSSPNYLAGRTPINAVEVMARRTANSPGGSVGFLFPRILPGWTSMQVRRTAIATRKPLAVPGIPLCIKSCDLATPVNLLTQETGGGNACIEPNCQNNTNRMAFTAFSPMQAPNVGANGDVVDYIWGRLPVPELCEICMTTNNTTGGGSALGEVKNAFDDKAYKRADKTFDSIGNVTSWRVAVPLVDRKCSESSPNSCSACPPGCQGNFEPYHVAQIAVVVITAVNDSGAASERGITISSINCMSCPTSLPLSKEAILVR